MTDEQKEIVNTPGHVVVTARAGTGKTTVVVERIRRAIADGIDPDSIVAITYTVAAAREIQERLGVQLGHCGTLHSYAIRLAKLGHLRIATEEEIKEAIEEATTSLQVKGTTIKAILAGLEASVEPVGNLGVVVRHVRYELRQRGIQTFGMALVACLRSGKLGQWIRTDLLVVDEMQDSAEIDLAIYAGIKPMESLFVGDDLQAIYGFRGSSPRHFRRLLRDPDRTVLTLGRTFRFGPAIVDAANELCDAGMISARGDAFKSAVAFVPCRTEGAELEAIVDFLRRRQDDATSMAVLTRYNETVRGLAANLLAAGLEVKVRTKGQDERLLIDCLRVLAGATLPADEAAFNLAERLGARFAKVQGLNSRIEQFRIARQRGIDYGATQGLLSLGLSHQEAIAAGGQGPDSLSPPEALEAALIGQTARVGIGGIEVTTIHQAKGREWDHVCLAAAYDRPNSRDAHEDLRLFYVAITRTRGDLLITAVGKPSRFIEQAGIPIVELAI